jgi:hypothetical protein
MKQSYLRHIVLFKFKDASSSEEIDHVVKSFMALKELVPQIKNMEWGENISAEIYHQGFTHCFIFSYHSEQDLAEYQTHQAHVTFQSVLKPHMEKVFVVDYWTS